MNNPDDEARRYGKTMYFFMWLIILVFLYVLFDRWYDQQLNPNRNLNTHIDAAGNREVVLKRNRARAYTVPGTINDVEVNFLVDTGATTVAIPAALAQRIGLPRGTAVQVLTAGGTVTAYTTRINRLQIGPISLEEVSATITPSMAGDKVLLGMTALKHMTFKQIGDTLILTQPAGP